MHVDVIDDTHTTVEAKHAGKVRRRGFQDALMGDEVSTFADDGEV